MSAGATVERPPLWEGQKIRVIVVTGEFSSGKSIFCCSICPGEETLVIDNEGSTENLEDQIGFDRIDLSHECYKKHGERYTAEDRYQMWRKLAIERGKTKKYRVLVTDPFSEIEDGLADYVNKHPGEFGYTANQFEKGGGIFWGCVKRKEKADIELLKTYYETICFVVHMRNEFRGGKPTGKREAKGKETLEEEANLMLLMERRILTTGKDKGKKQSVPSAVILKERVNKAVFDEHGQMRLVPLLPPRLPIATPAAIRAYIRNPPNYDKLKADEKIIQPEMSEEEKLELQRVIAEDNRIAAESQVQIAAKQAKIAEFNAKIRENAPQSSDQSAELAERKREKAEDAAREAEETDEQESESTPPAQFEPVSHETLAMIKAKGKEVFTNETFKLYLQEHGIASPAEMTQDQGEECLKYIYDTITAKNAPALAEKAEQLKEEGKSQSMSAMVDHAEDTIEDGESTEPGSISVARVAAIRELAKETNWSQESQEKALQNFGASTWRNLSQAQGATIINKLKGVLAKQAEAARGAIPGN